MSTHMQLHVDFMGHPGILYSEFLVSLLVFKFMYMVSVRGHAKPCLHVIDAIVLLWTQLDWSCNPLLHPKRCNENVVDLRLCMNLGFSPIDELNVNISALDKYLVYFCATYSHEMSPTGCYKFASHDNCYHISNFYWEKSWNTSK